MSMLFPENTTYFLLYSTSLMSNNLIKFNLLDMFLKVGLLIAADYSYPILVRYLHENFSGVFKASFHFCPMTSKRMLNILTKVLVFFMRFE